MRKYICFFLVLMICNRLWASDGSQQALTLPKMQELAPMPFTPFMPQPRPGQQDGLVNVLVPQAPSSQSSQQAGFPSLFSVTGPSSDADNESEDEVDGLQEFDDIGGAGDEFSDPTVALLGRLAGINIHPRHHRALSAELHKRGLSGVVQEEDVEIFVEQEEDDDQVTVQRRGRFEEGAVELMKVGFPIVMKFLHEEVERQRERHEETDQQRQTAVQQWQDAANAVEKKDKKISQCNRLFTASTLTTAGSVLGFFITTAWAIYTHFSGQKGDCQCPASTANLTGM